MAITVPMGYIAQGDIVGALYWMFSSYLPMGILWAWLGLILFFVMYTKTESWAISGVVFMFAMSMIGFALDPSIRNWFTLLIGIAGAILFYKVIRS